MSTAVHTCRRSVQWVLVCHSIVQPCTSGVWPRNVRAMADPLWTTDSAWCLNPVLGHYLMLGQETPMIQVCNIVTDKQEEGSSAL